MRDSLLPANRSACPDTGVTADRTDPEVAYVTLSGFREYDNQGHMYRTTNYGASWADIGTTLPDVPLNDVLVDPDFPSK